MLTRHHAISSGTLDVRLCGTSEHVSTACNSLQYFTPGHELAGQDCAILRQSERVVCAAVQDRYATHLPHKHRCRPTGNDELASREG